MNVAVFSTKPYDERFLKQANADHGHDLTFFEPRLTLETAPLAHDFEGICCFVNDRLSREVLAVLAQGATRTIALRSAGFNNVDLRAADELGFTVVRVPEYSPEAVAEHTIALILALNRKVHRAYWRVRDGNFSLEGLLGFDLARRTVGVVGTGRIGRGVARILHGFGCRLLAYDLFPHPDVEALGAAYVPLDQLFREADIISLHIPLTPETYHLIDAEAIATMKPGVMLINLSRGKIVDTRAVNEALRDHKIGAVGLDVYEEEENLFFEDLSGQVIEDDVFARLVSFPNVIVTGHQGFFTEEALTNIAETTLGNLADVEAGRESGNRVRGEA